MHAATEIIRRRNTQLLRVTRPLPNELDSRRLGAVFSTGAGEAGVAHGGVLDFRSLHIALRLNVQSFRALVILLGTVLGLLTALVRSANAFEPSFRHSHVYAVLAVSILAVETFALLRIVRVWPFARRAPS